MERQLSFVGVLAVLLVLAGCGSNPPVAGPDPNPPVFSGGGDGGGQTTPREGSGNIAMTPEEQLAADQRSEGIRDFIFYFDFDRADIQPQYSDQLAAHARFLTSRPNSYVRLEGHADETGSREYNIGLGERRAQAVRRILMLQGASASQLRTVSYGEERPAALGSDEESYSLNRRVELVYE